jgi:hypothetical protein
MKNPRETQEWAEVLEQTAQNLRQQSETLHRGVQLAQVRPGRGTFALYSPNPRQNYQIGFRTFVQKRV